MSPQVNRAVGRGVQGLMWMAGTYWGSRFGSRAQLISVCLRFEGCPVGCYSIKALIRGNAAA
jgi:hypothetical protein